MTNIGEQKDRFICKELKIEYTGQCFSDEAGRVQLLELMEKSGKLGRFLAWLNGLSLDEDGDLIDNCVPVDFLLDNTGLLRDKVFERLGGEEWVE